MVNGKKMIIKYEINVLTAYIECEKEILPLIINGRRFIPENVDTLIFSAPNYPDKLIYNGVNAIPPSVKNIVISADLLRYITSFMKYVENGVHIIPDTVKSYCITMNNHTHYNSYLNIIKDGVSFINNGAKHVEITAQYIDHPLIMDGVKAFPDTIEKLFIHTDWFYRDTQEKNRSSIYFKRLASGFCKETLRSVFPENLKELSGLGIFNPYKLMNNGITTLPLGLQKLTYINVKSFAYNEMIEQTYIFLVMDGKRILPNSLRILEIENFYGDLIIDGVCVFPDNLRSLKISFAKFGELCFPDKLKTLKINTCLNFSYFSDDGRKTLPDSIVPFSSLKE